MRVGLAPHFIGDAITAFITLLPVPGVTGELATGLLFMKLQGQKKNTVTVGGIVHGTQDVDVL